jgi:hypothetical protein
MLITALVLLGMVIIAVAGIALCLKASEKVFDTAFDTDEYMWEDTNELR